ncbi:hypothetical protein KHP62_19650 [Rhodobacteraceae bacterium NNCM2]|nr:hypothetical protein [Coraliihabitans acroporae]
MQFSLGIDGIFRPRVSWLLTFMLLPNGPASAAAPVVPIFGSYFPWWLLCLLLAVVATVVIRVIFIVIRLDDIMRWRAATYMSMAIGLTFVFSNYLFGR